MSGTNLLLVLAVHEPGLRSMLAAKLSLLGGDVITTHDIEDPALERAMHGSAALIVDEALVAHQPPGWIEGLCGDSRWHHIVVLTVQVSKSPPTNVDSRLYFVDRSSAADAIAEMLPYWRTD